MTFLDYPLSWIICCTRPHQELKQINEEVTFITQSGVQIRNTINHRSSSPECPSIKICTSVSSTKSQKTFACVSFSFDVQTFGFKICRKLNSKLKKKIFFWNEINSNSDYTTKIECEVFSFFLHSIFIRTDSTSLIVCCTCPISGLSFG